MGTLARIALGIGFLAWGLTYEGTFVIPLRTVAILAGALGVLLVFQVTLRLSDAPPFRTDSPLAHAIGIIAFVASISLRPIAQAGLLFFGSSLLLAAARGYAGCEVTAITNTLLRREDHVGCVVLGPIDAMERARSGRRS